ncbi:MAG: alpha-glucosidase/alpha-galactosidase [Armatimonadetes bacterium]|nr:alpha-glucosidase/alpha-galactosidase [Armatimonadota bacterium]
MKIVLIGAGSADFGTGNLEALLRCEKLHGANLALVDIDQERLTLIEGLAARGNSEWGSAMTLSATTERREVLEGADFVVVSVAVDREDRWRLDFETTLPFGLRQPYAENGGPGGLAHSLRNIPIVMGIARDMEELCPDAWMLSYTNPVPRITAAVHRHSAIKVVGLCPSVYILEDQVSQVLNLPTDRVQVVGAGLNHFGWVLDIRDTATGEDLYPAFREKSRMGDASWSPLSRALLERTGYFPYPSDDHIAEYLNLCHHPERKPWKLWGLHQYDYREHSAEREALWHRVREVVEGGAPLDRVGESAEQEMTVPMIRGLGFGEEVVMPGVNIPNEGYVPNLQQGGIVEVPALVTACGARGIVVGDLPEPIAGWCNLQISICNLAADAGVTGSREKALQALLLDPMVNDIEQAEQILAAYLKVHADYLPQFS